MQELKLLKQDTERRDEIKTEHLGSRTATRSSIIFLDQGKIIANEDAMIINSEC